MKTNEKLPPCELYSDLLHKAVNKFNITINEARNKYGTKTTKQWYKLLK
jgi:hypothetical protein